jgi:hypothetical protein
MAKERNKGISWPVVVATAFLTALGTSLAETWLPDAVKTLYARITNEPVLVIHVRRQGTREPLNKVVVWAELATTGKPLATAVTDEKGIARLQKIPGGNTKILLCAKLDEGKTQLLYEEAHDIAEVPFYLILSAGDQRWRRKEFDPYVKPSGQTVVETDTGQNIRIEQEGEQYFASIDGGTRFLVGAGVSFQGNRGLLNVGSHNQPQSSSWFPGSYALLVMASRKSL